MDRDRVVLPGSATAKLTTQFAVNERKRFIVLRLHDVIE
jgi:hypothetical protein